MLSGEIWEVPMICIFWQDFMPEEKSLNILIVSIVEEVKMLKTKRVTEIYDLRVFTDDGNYFGDVEESIIAANKLFGWRIRATKGSYLSKVLGGAKGVIVPHQLVKSIGDVIIVSKAAVPSYESEEQADGPAAAASAKMR